MIYISLSHNVLEFIYLFIYFIFSASFIPAGPVGPVGPLSPVSPLVPVGNKQYYGKMHLVNAHYTFGTR